MTPQLNNEAQSITDAGIPKQSRLHFFGQTLFGVFLALGIYVAIIYATMLVFFVGSESYSQDIFYFAYGIALILIPGLATILHFGRRPGHRFDRNQVFRSFSYLLNRLLIATCLFPVLTYALRNSIIERYITSFGLYEKSFSLHFEYILVLTATLTFLLYALFVHMRKGKEHLWILFVSWIVLLFIPLILAFGADQVRAQKPDEGAAQAKNIGECIHMKKTENWETCINKTLHTESDYKFCEFHLSRSLAFESKSININTMANYCQDQWAIASNNVNVCNQLSSQSPDDCKRKMFERSTPEVAATLCSDKSKDLVKLVGYTKCYQKAKPFFDDHPDIFKTFCDQAQATIIEVATNKQEDNAFRKLGNACGIFSATGSAQPIITDVNLRQSLGSALFFWSTQVSASSEVSYGFSEQYGQQKVDTHYLVGIHQVQIDTQSGKQYHYSIQSCTAPPDVRCTATPDATFFAQ